MGNVRCDAVTLYSTIYTVAFTPTPLRALRSALNLRCMVTFSRALRNAESETRRDAMCVKNASPGRLHSGVIKALKNCCNFHLAHMRYFSLTAHYAMCRFALAHTLGDTRNNIVASESNFRLDCLLHLLLVTLRSGSFPLLLHHALSKEMRLRLPK